MRATASRRSRLDTEASGSESNVTVLIALAANALVAIAKTFAAAISGSASMVAESAHSWADTGNEIFLFIANRRSNRAADMRHPLGYGRDVYVWSLFAAFGLFTVGAVVSIMHGVQELFAAEPAEDFTLNYVVLGIAFVLEGISFLQALRQVRSAADTSDTDLFDYVLNTSDPTVRAVFFEDAAALIGLLIAFGGILAHQLTGSPIPDAVGSILVGLLLGVVAIVLIQRNRRFLVGEAVDHRVRTAALERLLDSPAVASVSYLHIEYVGPGRVYLVAAVDLVGDERERELAVDLAELEGLIESSPRVVRAVLTLSTPGAEPLSP
ncbi:cation diffusion facilitator family transporter [Amnibacterium flavum]|uniref:Cation transporter n=1 Tax=Amnibacterium flavum TaxID=2173173 RepID=A0A2V1HMW5_9MICO|nr:cation diffusion facilitator family transporter [Amnibacterium flavum]PVZ93963.1 cation transporter [Amnibacterium flavum]